MKKLVITILLAIITSLTIYFVAFWNPSNSNIAKENIKVKNVQEEKYKNIENDKNNISNKNNNIDEKIEESKKGKDSEVIEENTDDSIDTKDNYNNVDFNENVKNNNKNNDKENSMQANAKIFNINKNEIFESLSLKDKTKLFSVAKKISTVDGEKIKKSIENENEIEGISEAFRIIKLRLTENDYKQVKEILSPYINIELLEELV